MVFMVIVLLGLLERLAEIGVTVGLELATKHPDENRMVVACSIE